MLFGDALAKAARMYTPRSIVLVKEARVRWCTESFGF